MLIDPSNTFLRTTSTVAAEDSSSTARGLDQAAVLPTVENETFEKTIAARHVLDAADSGDKELKP